MEIQSNRENQTLVLTLVGRLDATWSDPVEAALDAAVRSGEHCIVMDFTGVDYISSAGLRVVIAGYKQLKSIQGSISVRNARPGVAKVIELSGLGTLLSTSAPATEASVAASRFESDHATWETHGSLAPVKLRTVGGTSVFDVSGGELIEFTDARFGLGVAALASSREEALPRLGEFLSVAGCAAHLSASGASRPDFLIAEQAFIPSGFLTSGLVADGVPDLLLRFDVRGDYRGVPLAEVAEATLRKAGTSAAVFIMVAETSGLVGAALRKSPAHINGDPFAFPSIRDHLSFTSERVHRDTTSVTVGVVARPGSAWTASLRPIDAGGATLGHFHAAVFPYRPIRKGNIPLVETVRDLFELGGLQALLHLLNDTRDPEGSGDSEFQRGACWVAPVSQEHEP